MRTRRLVVALAPGVLVILGLVAGWGDVYRPVAARSVPTEVERLRAENRALRLELELAAQPGPYLLMDLSEPSLTLKSHGVPLRSFPVRTAEVRSARVLWLRERGLPVLDTVWSGGALLPARHLERVVIESDTVAPPDKDGSVSFIPPTPEEEHPVKPTFRIRFGGGLSALVVAGPVEPDKAGGEPDAGQEVVAAPMNPFRRLAAWLGMKPWRRDPARLDLVLAPADAAALYRAWTDGTPLLLTGWP